MLRGYRFLVTAACGLTVLIALGTGAYFSSLYAPDHKRYQTVTDNQSGGNDYQGPSQSLPDIAGLPGLVERAIANPHPATGEDHEIRDLAAQEASALWAFWMVVISCASVLITAVGTVFLYKQIVLTREAVQDTGRATAAMERQNELADQAQRPWLEIEVGFDFISKTDKGFIASLAVYLINIGRLPAYNAKIEPFLHVGTMNPIHELKMIAEMPWAEGHIYQSDLIVLPGGKAEHQELIYLEKNDSRSFANGTVPQFMITVFYDLPDGRPGQSSAWFTLSMPKSKFGHEIIPWDWVPDGTKLIIEPMGYIRVT